MQHKENKPEDICESRKTKKISRQNKTIQTKQDMLKQRKEFYDQELGECINTYWQSNYKETNQNQRKIWKQIEQHRKAKSVSSNGKQLK